MLNLTASNDHRNTQYLVSDILATMAWRYGLCEPCFPPKSYTIMGSEACQN